MPFNGERNLEGCVIQHVGQHKLKPSVTLFQNFHRTASWNQLTHNERRSRMKLFALCRFAQDSGGSVRGRFILTYPREKKKSPKEVARDTARTREVARRETPSSRTRIKMRFIFPLTRKLPFAQVLRFALLAARHVGSVAALQLSSHWEIRSYKVDSK